MTFTSPTLSRRQFINVSAGLTIAAAGSCKAASGTSGAAVGFEHGEPLHEFQYREIVFLAGLHQTQLERTHDVLMGLNEDSLLRPFRLSASLPAPGLDLGGWYSATSATTTASPSTFGQWLSALSRYYAATGDQATLEKVTRLVRGFAQTIESSGRLYAIAKEGGQIGYFYDKLVCGLSDAFSLTRLPEAQEALARASAAATPFLPGKAIDRLSPGGTNGSESYTIPENQFIAWQRTGDLSRLEMAKQYLADAFYFEPLSRGENVLPGRHAYSHVNALCSAAKAYLVLGDPKHLKAAVNGFGFIEEQSFATGGWGPQELFLPRPAFDFVDPITGRKEHRPAVRNLGESVIQEFSHFETPCGAYAHFKLTRYLLRITKDSRYGDSMERVMYNTVLGAKSLNRLGKAFYQSNYHSHARKLYFDGYDGAILDEWPCCSGTLPQIAADYRISTYLYDGQGIFVNLYIPSNVRWQLNDTQVELTQSGAYPLGDSVNLDIATSRPMRFALRFRIPAWTRGASLRINGKLESTPVTPGMFATVHRKWRDGDRVELKLPRIVDLKAADTEHPNLVALTCGPLVLFVLGDNAPKVSRAQLLAAEQMNDDVEWRVEADAGPMRLVPFWAINDEPYSTYIPV